jgi:GlpG protein
MKKFRITINAPVTLCFVLICFIVTLLGTLSNGTITQAFFMTYRSSLLDPLTYVRLFGHVFGHEGWDHFFGNACYLLLLGPMLEEKYGSKALMILIALTALVTGIFNSIFFANTGLYGASGVVFAFIILASFTGFRHGEIPLSFILVAIIFIGQQIYDGVMLVDNISNSAHIVGGTVGAIAGYNLNKNKAN